MDSNKSYKYYVVDLDPLYKDFERYWCIPASWIRMKQSDQRVMVAFPLEETSKTKKRVRDGKDFSGSGTVLMGDVKFGADSYKEADNYITKLKNRLLQEQSYAEIIQEHESSTSYEPESPVGLLQRDLESTDPQEIVPENTLCANLNVTTRKKQTKAVGIGDATNRKMTTLHQSSCKQLPSTSARTEENELPYEHSAAISNDSINATHESSANENKENNYALSADDIIKLIFESDFLEQFKKKHSSLEQGLIKKDQMRLNYDNLTVIMENIIKLIENYKKDHIDQTNTTIKDITVIDVDETEKDEGLVNEEAKTNPRQGTRKSTDTTVKDHHTDNYIKKYKNIPRKRRFLSAFTLPEEYDKNDSRWTMKHPKAKPGLDELLPHSKVYVDAIGLDICKQESFDRRSLARLLLLEIFCESALSVCTVTGKKGFYYKDMGYTSRPGLDENAIVVLLNYVELYGNKQNWPKVEVQCMMHCIQNKLRGIRYRLYR